MPQTAIQTSSQPKSANLSGIKKAAILLVFLGEKISSAVIKELHNEEVKVIGTEIANLGFVNDEISNLVVDECRSSVVEGKEKIRGERDYVRKVVESAFEPKVASEILRYLSGESMSTTESLKAIRYAEPSQLFELIKFEHPQTAAVLLSHMEAESSAEVIRLHPEELRADIMMRLAQMDQVSKPVRNKVAEIIAGKLRQGGHFDQGVEGGVRKVAEIFNRLDRKLSRKTLESIEDEDPKLALSIRNLMFVFDDILLLTDTDMRKIIQRVDKQSLVSALKGTAEELKEHFYRNMSKRAVEMLKEDMDALGPMRLKEVESARQQVVSVIREMDGSGEIDLGGSGGDQYVV